jgi:hypothetical protein
MQKESTRDISTGQMGEEGVGVALASGFAGAVTDRDEAAPDKGVLALELSHAAPTKNGSMAKTRRIVECMGEV